MTAPFEPAPPETEDHRDDLRRGGPLPSFYDDLAGSLAEAWRLLVRGAADRRSPFHTMQVASIRPDGWPAVRTVVLRGVDPPARTLRFHTDRRAGKLADLAADPRVQIHLYDPGRKLQLRLDGLATVHADGPLHAACWAATRPMGRACYRTPAAPGQPLDDPSVVIPEPEHADHGRDRFTVVTVRAETLDWLYLHVAGHRRARFDLTGAEPAGTWVGP